MKKREIREQYQEHMNIKTELTVAAKTARLRSESIYSVLILIKYISFSHLNQVRPELRLWLQKKVPEFQF